MTKNVLFKGGIVYNSAKVTQCLNWLPFLTIHTQAIMRHVTGDFGDIGSSGVEENMAAIEYGRKIVSIYALPKELKSTLGVKSDLLITTEANREATYIMFYEEFEEADMKQIHNTVSKEILKAKGDA